MNIELDPNNRSIKLDFTVQEWAVMLESNKRQLNGFRDLLLGWLRNVQSSFIEEDRRELEQRVKTLTPEQITKIKQALGI